MKLGTGLLLITISGLAQADVLTLPGGPANPPPQADIIPPPSADYSALPPRGTLKSAVLARYGEPQSMSPAVGDPPISRWVYDEFVVFFEYEHVISAVIPGQPRPIYNQDELRPGY